MSRGMMLVCVVAIVASCGGDSTGETTADTATTTSTSTTSTSTTTTTTTTTTLPPTTTSTTEPPTPAEVRAMTVEYVESEGWIRHEDETGWSIWYPGDWTVAYAEGGDLGLVSPGTSDTVSVFTVSIALDAAPENEGSLDYLLHEAELSRSVLGLIEPYDSEDWFHLDLDVDEVEDPFDIYGLELRLARDPLSGDPIPEGGVAAPLWLYAYYNPDVRPAYGYVFQIWGTDPVAFEDVDSVVWLFEPPGGIPGLNSG